MYISVWLMGITFEVLCSRLLLFYILYFLDSEISKSTGNVLYKKFSEAFVKTKTTNIKILFQVRQVYNNKQNIWCNLYCYICKKIKCWNPDHGPGISNTLHGIRNKIVNRIIYSDVTIIRNWRSILSLQKIKQIQSSYLPVNAGCSFSRASHMWRTLSKAIEIIWVMALLILHFVMFIQFMPW